MNFLKPTKYCDFENELIKNKALEITKNDKDIIEKIKKIFYFMRDQIKYKFDFFNIKASETLKKSSGMCANKANLQVTLLRSINIPASYGIIKVSKFCLQPIIKKEIFEKIKSEILHYFCYAYVNNKWVPFDTTVDKELHKIVYKDDWSIEWNTDGLIQIPKNFFVNEPRMYPNVDHFLEIPPEFINEEMIDEMNIYLKSLRKCDKNG